MMPFTCKYRGCGSDATGLHAIPSNRSTLAVTSTVGDQVMTPPTAYTRARKARTPACGESANCSRNLECAILFTLGGSATTRFRWLPPGPPPGLGSVRIGVNPGGSARNLADRRASALIDRVAGGKPVETQGVALFASRRGWHGSILLTTNLASRDWPFQGPPAPPRRLSG